LELLMPYTYTLVSLIAATPREVYETWLDSAGHSKMTGAEAVMSDQVGAAVSAWDGYIGGRNLELVPAERIVQSWRTTKFTAEHPDSVITVTLEEADGGGTLLTLEHSNVPDEQRNYQEGGWEDNYFEPMRLYFGGGEEAPQSRKKPKTRVAAKKPKTKSAKSKARKAKAPKSKSAKKKPAKRLAMKKRIKRKAKSRRGKRK
jgi:uncharacterized protein YndB with AHSA1/START domain